MDNPAEPDGVRQWERPMLQFFMQHGPPVYFVD